MLHIVNKSPAQSNALASCLRLAQDGHALLLIEDAVYAASAEANALAGARGRLKLYALAPDLAARGMMARVGADITLVDYAGFVDLVAEYPTSQSWL